MLENIMYYILGICIGAMAAMNSTGNMIFIAICISCVTIGLIMTSSYKDI